jgi:hypothetical protein
MISVDMPMADFRRQASLFLRRLPEDALKPATHELAVDIAQETAKGVEFGLGGPRRVKTGRYLAGWAQAVRRLVGGSTVDIPLQNTSSRDGSSRTSGRGLTLEVEVTNKVDHAPSVEAGTNSMAAGGHLERALRVVTDRLRRGRSGAQVLADRIHNLFYGA